MPEISLESTVGQVNISGMIKAKKPKRLISYCVPGAITARRPVSVHLPFIRAEIGFSPKWYRQYLAIDFGERWHTQPEYRQEMLTAMRALLQERFGDMPIGQTREPEAPLDLLTGTYGDVIITSLFNRPIVYAEDNYPAYQAQYLDDAAADHLEVPEVEKHPFTLQLLEQMDAIEKLQGRIVGFLNFQGVFTNAKRLRGPALISDMTCCPRRAHHVLEMVCETMIAARALTQERQRQSGAHYVFATISNNDVREITPQQYHDFVLPYDQRIAQTFKCIGIHNGDLNVDAYLDDFVLVPKVGYIDMGAASDLARAKRLFPHARRALIYPASRLVHQSPEQIHADLERFAHVYAPCDIVTADIDAGTPDSQVRMLYAFCKSLSE